MSVGLIWPAGVVTLEFFPPKASPILILLLLFVRASFGPNLLPSVILAEITAKRSTRWNPTTVVY